MSVAGSPSETELHHFNTLRKLLQRDYLSRADWSYALRDLAAMAKEALGAQETFAALYDPSAQGWMAFTGEGQRLSDQDISAHGSRSVLERVRQSGAPVLNTGEEPLDFTSESLRMHEVQSVLAVPLHWWDVAEDRPAPELGGCLYAHRAGLDEPFAQSDVELVLDITRIAQPALNVLRHLRDVQAELDASRQRLQGLQQEAATRYRLGQYETADPAFAAAVLDTLRAAAKAEKVGMLILGPTGSGKSYLAQAYHYECPRKRGPFVVLDCSQATSEQTLAAELFGYAPQSGFANAPPGGRPGAAELAHKGTLFIDEIGALPRELQQRLLALIQTGSYSPLGTSARKQADLQVIAATNEDLHEQVAKKLFREDLLWRISMVTVRLPALSQRRADIPHLAEAFLRAACKQFGRRDIEGLSAAALRLLENFDWSRGGNVRGLEHALFRSVLLASPGTRRIDVPQMRLAEQLAAETTAARPGPGRVQEPASADEDPGLAAIRKAIQEHGYGTAAAKALGMTHGTLVWKLRKAGLTVRDVLAR